MRLLDYLLQAVYPDSAVCLLCGCVTHDDQLCPTCRHQLSVMRLNEELCPDCGAPLRPGKDCDCGLPRGLKARSAFLYAGPAAQLVQALKFSQVRSAAEPLAQGMADTIRSMALTGPVTLTWVSMPASRWRERAFDHAQVLAEETASLLSLPCKRLLERPQVMGELQHQVGLNAEQRAENLKGSFFCPEPLEGTVILVDDVYTTGSTAKAAASCLLESGASCVTAVTAARAVKG